MFIIYARYRGQARRRAQYVQEAAKALGTLEGVTEVHNLGTEELAVVSEQPEPACDVSMALLSSGDWALSFLIQQHGTLVLQPGEEQEAAISTARSLLSPQAKRGTVRVGVLFDDTPNRQWEADIYASFILLGFVLSKRTEEGREATALVRQGLSQIEIAEELGVSKQAISQRLQAAGWHAETVGYQQLLSLVRRASMQRGAHT